MCCCMCCAAPAKMWPGLGSAYAQLLVPHTVQQLHQVPRRPGARQTHQASHCSAAAPQLLQCMQLHLLTALWLAVQQAQQQQMQVQLQAAAISFSSQAQRHQAAEAATPSWLLNFWLQAPHTVHWQPPGKQDRQGERITCESSQRLGPHKRVHCSLGSTLHTAPRTAIVQHGPVHTPFRCGWFWLCRSSLTHTSTMGTSMHLHHIVQ